MTPLIDILLKETETLKIQFLYSTSEWADKYYNIYEIRSHWKDEQWCSLYGLVPELCNPERPCSYLGFPKNFYNTKKSKEHWKYLKEIKKIVKLGKEKYTFIETEKAEHRYIKSIEKLAIRIEEKGLNIENIKTISSHIGINFNTTITDGIKTVRAFTVLFRCEINRPHYRYLVK